LKNGIEIYINAIINNYNIIYLYLYIVFISKRVYVDFFFIIIIFFYLFILFFFFFTNLRCDESILNIVLLLFIDEFKLLNKTIYYNIYFLFNKKKESNKIIK